MARVFCPFGSRWLGRWLGQRSRGNKKGLRGYRKPLIFNGGQCGARTHDLWLRRTSVVSHDWPRLPAAPAFGTFPCAESTHGKTRLFDHPIYPFSYPNQIIAAASAAASARLSSHTAASSAPLSPFLRRDQSKGPIRRGHAACNPGIAPSPSWVLPGHRSTGVGCSPTCPSAEIFNVPGKREALNLHAIRVTNISQRVTISGFAGCGRG